MLAGLCDLYKLACIFCNLLIISVIFFDFTILVYLLLIQAFQSFFILSISSFIALFMGEGLLEFELNSNSKLKDWGSSTSLIIFRG